MEAMKDVMKELLFNIKNGFSSCNEKEIQLLHGRKILVIASARDGILEYLMEKILVPSESRISISGTYRCKRYIDEMKFLNTEYYFHEGIYSVNAPDYKILRGRQFDAVIYLVTQRDLYSYINIEEMCQDYTMHYKAEIYCMDLFGNLWKSRDINQYLLSKKAYKSLIDYYTLRKEQGGERPL